MSGFFISYRREDARGHAGRLYDDLRVQFGDDEVFIDVDRMDPGINFVERINEVVAAADAIIAVIGSQWLRPTNAHGQRRLDDPNDFVRLEIATALTQRLRVVPVLVDGASMPRPDELPEDLRELAHRHAVELSDTRWDYDVGRLIDAMGGRSMVTQRRRRRLMAAAGGALLAVALLVAGVLAIASGFLRSNPPDVPDGGDAPSFDSTVGHVEQSQQLGDFLQRHDREPVNLNAGFQGLSFSDFSAQGFGELQSSSNGTAIRLYTKCTPPLSGAEKRRVELGSTEEVMGEAGRCQYTTLSIGRANDESQVYVTHGQPRIEGHFLVDVGDLAQGETMVELTPLTSEQAVRRN